MFKFLHILFYLILILTNNANAKENIMILKLNFFNVIHLKIYSDLKLIILSGSEAGSPLLILSTYSIPSITLPNTVY